MMNDENKSYFTFGEGEKKFVIIPGISVHGVVGLAGLIAASYKDFAQDYTVYVLDRPAQLKEDVTIKDLADDAAMTMDSLGIRDAYIFGASQGGMIVQQIAIDYPELVRKMILGSTLSRPNETIKRVTGEWLCLAESRDEEALASRFVEDVYSEKTLEKYRKALVMANSRITEEEYERLIKMIKSCRSFDCYDELPQIQCPVLVLGSEGDRVVTPEASREIAQRLGCEIYIYDSSYGHAVYDEAPDYKQRCKVFFEA